MVLEFGVQDGASANQYQQVGVRHYWRTWANHMHAAKRSNTFALSYVPWVAIVNRCPLSSKTYGTAAYYTSFIPAALNSSAAPWR
jgi:hypothetical protein